MESPRPAGRYLLVSVACAVLVAFASSASTLVVTLACIGNGALPHCNETYGGKVSVLEVLFCLGPGLATLAVGLVGVRRRSYLPTMLATIALLPAGLLLPFLAWP